MSARISSTTLPSPVAGRSRTTPVPPIVTCWEATSTEGRPAWLGALVRRRPVRTRRRTTVVAPTADPRLTQPLGRPTGPSDWAVRLGRPTGPSDWAVRLGRPTGPSGTRTDAPAG